jgi:anti-anti-sigma factor
VISVHIDVDGGIAHCRIGGDLDSYGTASLREAMAALVAFRAAVIDLTDAVFIDSAGLGVLVNTIRRMRDVGSDVALCAPRPAISRALHVAGVDRIVAVEASPDDALARLAPLAAS